MDEISIKIHRGTGRLTGDSLCKSCSHAMSWVDHKGEHTECSRMDLGTNPKGKVFECSAYYNSSLSSITDMNQIAWTLRTEKGGKMIGFTPPVKGKPPWEDVE